MCCVYTNIRKSIFIILKICIMKSLEGRIIKKKNFFFCRKDYNPVGFGEVGGWSVGRRKKKRTHDIKHRKNFFKSPLKEMRLKGNLNF